MKDDSAQPAASADITAAAPGASRQKLMLLAPVALAIGALIYAFSGRYVETDNAYVRGDIANLSSEISSPVREVLVKENQTVKAGQELVRLDSVNYDIMLLGAATQLRKSVTDIDVERAKYRENVEELKIAQTQLAFAERQFQRQAKLAAASAGAEAARDTAETALNTARGRVAVANAKIRESLDKLEGDPEIAPEKLPAYQIALAQQEMARLQVKRSILAAPFDGIVSHLPAVGDFARTGVSLISVVSTTNAWIEANFKETELTNMKPDQPVEVTVDAYPGRTWLGKVASIAQATGAEFSLLPAQNATGNWVKVVQRVPVRVALDTQAGGPTLRAGMSVNVTVDTGQNRLSSWFGGAAAP